MQPEAIISAVCHIYEIYESDIVKARNGLIIESACPENSVNKII